MQILLLPPDERPVSARLPQMIGACAGAEVVLPPPELLPSFRTPADCAALADWLPDHAAEADAVVVSLDLLAHGGLVPSRLSADHGAGVIARLDLLRELSLPAGVPVYATMVVTRVPDIDDATEEPSYWADHGQDIHALSAVLSRRAEETATAGDIAAARSRVPADVARDWLTRRLRNHTVNLAALQLVSDRTIDLLALTADDTAPTGLPALERGWLEGWTARLGLDHEVFHYPGADEVPGVLIARLVLAARRRSVDVAVHAADTGGLARIAPYEDQPIVETIKAQVRAAGAGLVDDPDRADVILAVHPPSDVPGDWALAPPPRRGAVAPMTQRLADDISRFVATGRRVAVADCAWPNGGDPTLVELLTGADVLGHLAAYAGWNTAGNTIGSALAQALVQPEPGADTAREEAHERLLVHRLLEDVGYQTSVRGLVRTIVSDDPDAVTALVEEHLAAELPRLGSLAERWRIRPGSVRLPWQRTFECDFDLERVK